MCAACLDMDPSGALLSHSEPILVIQEGLGGLEVVNSMDPTDLRTSGSWDLTDLGSRETSRFCTWQIIWVQILYLADHLGPGPQI